MKIKNLMLVGGLSLAFGLTVVSSASAFWPFDAIKGAVKAAVTDRKVQEKLIYRDPAPVPGKINIGNDVVMRNLSNMVAACNEIAKNPIQITPQPRQTFQGGGTDRMVTTKEFVASDTKASAELKSVMSLLNTKCKEIIMLNERYGKVVIVTNPTPVRIDGDPYEINGKKQCTRDADCGTGMKCTENNTQNSKELKTGRCISTKSEPLIQNKKLVQ